MKKMTVKNVAVILMAFAMLFSFSVATCFAQGENFPADTTIPVDKMPIQIKYFQIHPTTVQDIEKMYGKPAATRVLTNGYEERFYKYLGTSEIGYRYYLNQKGKIVSSGIASSLPGK